MKKSLLFGIMCVAASGAFAQAAPEILPYMYGQKLSPDGQWIVGEGIDGSIIVYDMTTGPEDAGVYNECYFGNGNTFALDGTCVGSTWYDEPVIYKGAEMNYVDALEDATFCSLNGITADGARICGTINNPSEQKGAMYVPFILDRDANGEYSEVKYLPFPEKDFTDDFPQYVNAVWINDAGNVVLGQVIDSSGMFIYPIVFKENEAGEWSYTLPTEALWNPNHIELPENPGDFDMVYPDPLSYMSQDEVAAYNAAYQAWVDSGYVTELYPNPTDYMSADNKAAYEAYLAEYQAAAQEYDAKIMAYLTARNQIYDESTPFLQNGFTMNAEGTLFAAAAERYEFPEGAWMPVTYYDTYIFNITNGSYSKVDSKYTDIVPNQISDKGEVLGSTPANTWSGVPTTSYVFVSGHPDYVPLQNYLISRDKDACMWMIKNLACDVQVDYDPETFEPIYESYINTGHACASNDFDIMAGGVFSYMLPDEEYADMGYMTYILTGVKTDVKAVALDNSAVKALRGGVLAVSGNVSNLAVYDLSGRKLFSVPAANGNVNTYLGNGIYVVAYTDAEGNKCSKKVTF